MKAAMKCLYWLAKQEITHTTNYVGLLELVQSLGATYLRYLNIGGNAHHTSERFLQEAMTLLGEVISKSIFDDFRTSPFFALICDETTDVGIYSEGGYHLHLVPWPCDRKVCTSFIGIIEVADSHSHTHPHTKNIPSYLPSPYAYPTLHLDHAYPT